MRGQPRKSSFVEMLVDVSQKQQEKEWGAVLKERDKLTKRESELQTIHRKQCIWGELQISIMWRCYEILQQSKRKSKSA
jgi:hypothetical protein